MTGAIILSILLTAIASYPICRILLFLYTRSVRRSMMSASCVDESRPPARIDCAPPARRGRRSGILHGRVHPRSPVPQRRLPRAPSAAGGTPAFRWSGLLSTHPVRDRKTRDTAELALVVRDQRQPARHGLCGDERVQWADRSAGAFELCTHLRVNDCIAGAELDDGERPEKVLDQAECLHRRRALGGAREELRLGDDTQSDIFSLRGQEMLQNPRVLLERVDAGIGVEKELHTAFSIDFAALLDFALRGALEIVRDPRE